MPYRTLQKDGTVAEGFAQRPVIDALHGPTGNKEPLIVQPSSPPSPGSVDSTSDSTGQGGATSGSRKPTSTAAPSSPNGSPASPSGTTCAVWGWADEMLDTPRPGEIGTIRIGSTVGAPTPHLTSSVAASPVRTSASPGDDGDSPGNDPASSSPSPSSLSLFDPSGYSSRTYQGSSPRTAVGTSGSCLERWPTSGTAWHGGFSTAVSSECPSAGGVCSSSPTTLADVLEPNAPARYSLSARAAAGILRRAEKRGRELPGALLTALRSVAA